MRIVNISKLSGELDNLVVYLVLLRNLEGTEKVIEVLQQMVSKELGLRMKIIIRKYTVFIS